MIAWVDLETSGLEDHDRILEVACIVTDDSLTEVARFQAVTSEAQNVCASKVDEKVIKMHLATGLWQESLLKKWISWDHEEVEIMLCKFIRHHSIGSNPVTPAGSSVWFDVKFLKRYMSNVAALFDRHVIDVATLNEVVKRAWPNLYDGRPVGRAVHRAMPDVEDALELARYYTVNLGPVTK